MKTGSSLDGVVAAVSYMESSGVFNAGKGACLNVEGQATLDAAVMTGAGKRGCGIGAVKCTHHAVALARWLMENTQHVLFVGDDTEDYARAAGLKIETLLPTAAAKRKYSALLRSTGGIPGRNLSIWKRMREGNTVGAVAIDRERVPSAAVSTGGTWLKLPGRVGDSAIIGAGIYADPARGAACATGVGEEIIKNALSWNASECMTDVRAQEAADRAVALMTKRSGPDTAGIITVDLRGRVGVAYNTQVMGRAWYDIDRDGVHVRV